MPNDRNYRKRKSGIFSHINSFEFKGKMQNMKAKFETLKMSYKTENFLCNFPCFKDLKEGTLVDEDMSVDSDENREDSLNSKEELKEIISESSFVQENREIKSKEIKRKNFLSMTIKEKNKSMKIDDFETEFLAKINLKRKILMSKEDCLYENNDLNMFDFNFDRPKPYKIYYKLGNIENNLKKLQIFLKRKDRKRRRCKNDVMRKEKITSSFININ